MIKSWPFRTEKSEDHLQVKTYFLQLLQEGANFVVQSFDLKD